ncbi:hypothetical protein A2348_04685 [Candidatus Uhrbacteria bacterium RIFOXYB12_FULL_58_10]|nr:MAG: hypothetical protein A2348_04685 [Candidatus Uhrbacteria bacterium RIFOXYB12_FULL_58_10]OGL98974.1 MAG: hypothetical protein A2501_02495 [Candidatus Uhrbacteria bacterium RIFOXYC12_FULL_57_11]
MLRKITPGLGEVAYAKGTNQTQSLTGAHTACGGHTCASGEPSRLFEAIVRSFEEQKAQKTKPPEDYLYVIYRRKSTDDDKKQRQTLDDQLKDCMAIAEQYNLKIAKVFTESVSAKEPGIRPKFREMMDGLMRGRYDGIISRAPDRLARNMREGGEIIDLLDQGIIKDLRFHSMTFMNTAEGKMLLGISFVMAKQWVEGHAGRVKDATDKRTREGVNLGKPKHGYYNDNMGCMRPDSENWQLIRGVFDRRFQGMGLKEIAAWLKAEEYPRKTGHERLSVVVDTAFISSLPQETAYAGW